MTTPCIGGVTALDLMGLNFSVPAAIGFLALFGITVMEGIILLSHFHHLKDGAMPWRQALDQAGVDRMRPVMMTRFAAVVGLRWRWQPASARTCRSRWRWWWWAGRPSCRSLILVVFPAMIDLFGRTASARTPMPGGAARKA